MSVYLNVDRMVRNVDHGDVTRETLFQQRSRYKKAGKMAEVEAITEALELTKCAASGVLRQAQRLAANFDGMDAEKALELKATVAAYASKSTDLQASVVLAFQSLFEAKGVTMDYDEVSAYLMLYAMDHFDRITGELPVIVH